MRACSGQKDTFPCAKSTGTASCNALLASDAGASLHRPKAAYGGQLLECAYSYPPQKNRPGEGSV